MTPLLTSLLSSSSRCCAARAIWNFPVMVLPPLIMAQVGPVLPPKAAMAVEVAVVGCLIMSCVPPALGAFAQTDEMESSNMEPQFQGLKDSKGELVTKFFFNKGL